MVSLFAWISKVTMNAHDLGYAKLFSHARMMQDLVAGFVHEEWVAGLDFSTLEKVNPIYVTDDFRKRIDDLVWKIGWRGTGRWLYIYLILESQSTVDDIMAVRTTLYEMLLYQDLRQSGKILEGQKFPPVVPIVLYNGSQRWTAAMDVADLLAESPPGLDIYRPHTRYLLVDEHRYQESELKSMHNVVAALFRLEKSRCLDEVRQVIEELDAWLKTSEQRELRRAWAKWLSRILLPRLAKKNLSVPESLPEMDDLEEVRTMLAETVEGWTREWKREGLKEGLKEGEVKMLTRLLQRRFGVVPDWASAKMGDADLSVLEEWGVRVLDAQSLNEVFSDRV